jgi:hypothetical protein
MNREIEAAMKANWLAGKLDEDEPIGENQIDDRCEVYVVHNNVWKQSGLDGYGGCLCIGCLEKRLGRRLEPKDFDRDHSFAKVPGTKRLLNWRDGRPE